MNVVEYFITSLTYISWEPCHTAAQEFIKKVYTRRTISACVVSALVNIYQKT